MSYTLRAHTLLFAHEHLKPNVSASVFAKKGINSEEKKLDRSEKAFFFPLSFLKEGSGERGILAVSLRDVRA